MTIAPNIKDLTAFVAVIEAGGFRDAARAIGSSPSAVSVASVPLNSSTLMVLGACSAEGGAEIGPG